MFRSFMLAFQKACRQVHKQYLNKYYSVITYFLAFLTKFAILLKSFTPFVSTPPLTSTPITPFNLSASPTFSGVSPPANIKCKLSGLSCLPTQSEIEFQSKSSPVPPASESNKGINE
ncbi:hypothetical protein WN66_01060 [Saccharomyces cerevisiae]|uniref:EC1118_1D0_2476p n=1 Tax=Saccharomyces cerevisiae (strain Lalvin EC1118 / Prise de mousse) TaxID=643680 RepID=C8Z4S8_YEAS8|nr:hypothetical protein WN66_01060 [Saccharomyces cerevisiae]CAY78517.1 EC1118_1D0_2476p [Saccharomyces cerevisiae EC1118]